MTGIGRDDLLSTAIGGGFLLGVAAAYRDSDPGMFEQTVGAVLRSCGELERTDPVMGRVLREKAYAVLHGRPEDQVPRPRQLGPGDRVVWTCGACGVIRETPLDGPDIKAAVEAAHREASPGCDGSLDAGTILGRIVDPDEDLKAIER